MKTDDRALAELRALAGSDRDLGERAAALRRRDDDAADLRARAEAVLNFFAGYPAEHDARRAALRETESEVARRAAELADAQSAAETAEDPEHARKAVERARDRLAVAQSALLRARAAHEDLESRASSLPDELAVLERRAGVTGAQAIVGWAAQEHVDVFVELGQLASQRERVIREANELASMLLGEETHGSTVAQALAKVVGPLARE